MVSTVRLLIVEAIVLYFSIKAGYDPSKIMIEILSCPTGNTSPCSQLHCSINGLSLHIDRTCQQSHTHDMITWVTTGRRDCSYRHMVRTIYELRGYLYTVEIIPKSILLFRKRRRMFK